MYLDCLNTTSSICHYLQLLVVEKRFGVSVVEAELALHSVSQIQKALTGVMNGVQI